MITDTERANLIAERLARDPKVQQIVADARLYDSLREHPAWQRLYSMTAAKKQKWMQKLTDRMLGARSRWPEPDEIAYYKGFYEGAFFVLAHPEHAERNLEKAADTAWILSFEEERDAEYQ